VWVDSVGTSSYTLGSRIVDRDGPDELVYAKASSVLVGVEAVTHAKRNLGATERDALAKHISAT
jgi:acyl-CoA thioester hydrolase